MEKKKLAIRYLVKNNIHAIAHLIGNRSAINRSIKFFFWCCKQQKSFGKHVGFTFFFCVCNTTYRIANTIKMLQVAPWALVSGVVCKYTCGRCNSSYYGCNFLLKVRSGEHIDIIIILDICRKAKLSKESAIRDHLLICNNIQSFDDFTILAYRHHKYILEIKENLLIKRDRHVLNKYISSAKLFLFENN